MISAIVYTSNSGYTAEYARLLGRATGLPVNDLRQVHTPQPDEEAEDAYFFVTDRKGNYYYARTYADHQKNCDAAAKVNKSLT